jgi:heme-degrading monooxygenase HmoA
MLLERAELTIREGQEEEFAALLKGRITEILLSVPGVHSVQTGRGVENPGKFLILAHWDSMAAHAAFRDLPIYPEFGKCFAPYSTGGVMEHFEIG